jgi:Eukaryotic translation initiation factor 3 subunit 7 (eIF-3)
VQNNRTRESSVVISPQWTMLEEIEFHRLAKLRLEVDEPDELCALLSFMILVLHLIVLAGIRMVDYLPMRNLMIASPPKRNAPYSL